MGYKLPDGRYVDDQGKTWKNYNDAAAAAATRRTRAETEFELGRQRQLHLNARNKLQQGQLGKQFFGWVPGLGAAIDRGMQADARAKQEASVAVRALTRQVDIYKARMGEGPMPPTRDLSEGNQQPGGTEPPKLPPVLSDDADARASEARRMLQQATPYWEREENQAIRAAAAEGGGPRAGEAGYAQRADIQAWMDAQRAKGPAGEAMVNRFIEQQKKRGLFEAPKPTPMVDQLAAPFDQREIAAMGYQGVKTEPQAMAGATAVQGVAPTADPRFEDPAYAAEVLRGTPMSPVSAIAGNEEQRAAAARGYSQAPAAEAFSAPVTLPNTAFVGNGMPQGVAMTPDRAQGVPGITDPLPTPEDTRDLNLNGEDALIRRYLSAIKGQ